MTAHNFPPKLLRRNDLYSTFAVEKRNLMHNTATNPHQAKTNSSCHKPKKAYPKTLKGCFSFEEFKDLLNEKIDEHYEKV